MRGWQPSPRVQARTAGILYLVAVLSAVFGEFVGHGQLGVAAVVIPIACYLLVTLLVYGIFKPVNRTLAGLMLLCGVVGLTFESLQVQPRGLSVGMVLHGIYCLLIGYLAFRSNFVPRILGGMMAFAGLVWLAYLFPVLAGVLSPWNTVVGLIAEAALMLWLLVMGVAQAPQPATVGALS